ncbi:hypothetical protein [Paenibacillus soyae]|uniref:Uncharacterized protein n=1 Tax=Paenibacillus soyae TaxID=2969249 RepID=A0A9X2MWH2_9BACL|nr:hypothetical protein [Paenibacillus soyae]MCR2807121.1 hypothetical protein [Paenibacillus soyae]
MNKTWKIVVISFVSVLLVCLIAAAIYINNIGYSNVKLMYELSKNSNVILKMETEGEYLTKANRHREVLKEKMKKEGWTFLHQEGAGYFFEKNGKETIITARQIWNRHYVVYKVTDRVVDLSS